MRQGAGGGTQANVPLASMTGFGAAERPWPEEDRRIVVEVRSVNARYREIRVRSDFGLADERSIHEAVAARVGRGKVTVVVAARPAAGCAGGAAERLAAHLEVAFERYGLAAAAARARGVPLAPPGLRDLLALADAGATGAPAAGPPWLAEVVGEAADALAAARRAEGRVLEAELRGLLDDLDGALSGVAGVLAGRERDLAEQLRAKVAALATVGLTEPAAERVEQELVVLLLRGDPREEQVRLAAHVARARAVLDAPAQSGQGRRLEFLGQEMVREAGTLATKAAGSGCDDDLLRIRLLVDRFREQVQNVE